MEHFTRVMGKLCLVSLFASLFFLGENNTQAQTFPNGTQSLDCCACEEGGTCSLVADSDPTAFNTADLTLFLLVDVNNGLVTGDDDDDLIDATSLTGTFNNVAPGDYVIYYVSYDAADAAALNSFFAADAPIADLLALGAEGTPGTWTSTDPSFIAIASSLATVNGPTCDCEEELDPICEDFQFYVNALCNPSNTEFEVLLVFEGGTPGTSGYNITNNITGTTFNNLVANSINFGPFPTGDGFSYTVEVADNPQCSITREASLIDCVVTSVELSRFDGEALDNGNELTWIVASEYESDFYILEHSYNGVDFKQVGTLKTQGNSNLAQTYQYLHNIQEAGLHYYRLKEVDLEGKVQIVSSVISVERMAGDLLISHIFPIPAVKEINLSFLLSNKSEVSIEVFDISGKLLQSQTFQANQGQNTASVDVTALVAGSYFIAVSNGESKQVQKFIKE